MFLRQSLSIALSRKQCHSKITNNFGKFSYYHSLIEQQQNSANINKCRSLSTLPSHLVVPMPALSPTMTSGSISKWNIKEGDKFDVGTVICEVETDKATVSYDATDSGYLAKILVQAGEIEVGQPIMITVEEQSEVAAFLNYQSPSTAAVSVQASAPPQVQEVSKSNATIPHVEQPMNSINTSTSNRIFASPLARKLLKDTSGTLSLQEVHEILSNTGGGSGPSGRITAADIVRASAIGIQKTTASPASLSTSAQATTSIVANRTSNSNIAGIYDDFLLSEQSIALAKRQTTAKQVVPHYYLSVELNLSNLLKLRTEFNTQSSGGKKGEKTSELSVLDFLVKASALAMKQVPDVNASWMDTFVRRYDQVDINVVMGSSGVAPVLRDVSSRGLSSISSEIDALEQALFSDDSSITEALLVDESKTALGTFSIHNLGMFGIKSAAPIVLTPQACALALGAIVDTVIPATTSDLNGVEWEVAPILTATLSCDHRVVDGAVGAQWLSAFKLLVENPTTMLM